MSFDIASYEGPRKTYNFTTGIMAVNKTIGAEAQAYFINHNRFVRVHFNVEGFQRLQFMTDLPIIANVEGKLMGQHSLSIEVGWPKTASTAHYLLGQYSRNFQSKGVIVIALRSLPKLCEIFRFICAIQIPAVPVVASARGEKLSVFAAGTTLDRGLVAFHIKVTLCEPTSSTATALPISVQDFILKHLGTIRAGGLDCSISGFDNQVTVDRTRAAMSPLLIYPGAFALDFVDMFRGIKRHTDPLATAGHLSSAHYRYTALSLWLTESWDFVQQEFDKSSTHRGQLALRRQSEQPLELLTIDLTFSLLAIAIHFRRPWDMFKHLDVLKAKLQTLTSRQRSWYRHLEGLVSLVGLDSSRLNDLSAASESIFLFAQSTILNSLPVKDDLITHDLNIISETLRGIQQSEGAESENGETPAFEILLQQMTTAMDRKADANANTPPRIRDLMPQLSIWTMPFRVYDSTDDPEIPPLAGAEGFVGWEDRAHLAELTKEDESAVQALQKSLGLQWSKLD